MIKKILNTPILIGILVVGIGLNFLSISKVNAGWNHLVTGNEWESRNISYDIAGGFSSAQESMIRDNTNSWDRQCTVNFDQDWYSGNDWWIESIDQLGLTTTSITTEGIIVKAVTRIDNDPAISSDYVPDSDEYSFSAIVAHEWGHWIRLKDDYSHSDALMYYSQGTGVRDATPNSEDIEACNYTY